MTTKRTYFTEFLLFHKTHVLKTYNAQMMMMMMMMIIIIIIIIM